MTRTPAPAEPRVDPRLARTLWQWFALGAVALCAFPELRGATALGWGPYWLVVAPLVALGVAYRHLVFTRTVGSDDFAAEPTGTAHRRRARAARGQAQRIATPRRDRRLRVA